MVKPRINFFFCCIFSPMARVIRMCLIAKFIMHNFNFFNAHTDSALLFLVKLSIGKLNGLRSRSSIHSRSWAAEYMEGLPGPDITGSRVKMPCFFHSGRVRSEQPMIRQTFFFAMRPTVGKSITTVLIRSFIGSSRHMHKHWILQA